MSAFANPNWTMPPGRCTAFPTNLGPSWSLFTLVFSHLEQQILSNSLNFSLPISAPSNRTTRETRIAVYVCPRDTGPDRVSMYDCGAPPAAGSTPQPVLNDLGPCSYLGCLGRADGGYPASLVGCYEY
jgi:hypothetical protein